MSINTISLATELHPPTSFTISLADGLQVCLVSRDSYFADDTAQMQPSEKKEAQVRARVALFILDTSAMPLLPPPPAPLRSQSKRAASSGREPGGVGHAIH